MTTTTTIYPIESAKETLLGMTLALEQRFGCTPHNDTGTTLNTKLGFQASVIPTAPKLVTYFCWGNGGSLSDTNNLTSAQPVSGTDMAPYSMRPFRAVPLAQDLSSTDRALYAGRVIENIGGIEYALYYLKLMTFTGGQVEYIYTDPVSGAVSTYALNYSNLNPTPPVANANGIITDVASSISVILPATMTITGEEVFESMSVIDGGDPRKGIVSELGFVSAATQSVSATDVNGNLFSYNEAIMAQMVKHYTMSGYPLPSTSDSMSKAISFSISSLIVG